MPFWFLELAENARAEVKEFLSPLSFVPKGSFKSADLVAKQQASPYTEKRLEIGYSAPIFA